MGEANSSAEDDLLLKNFFAEVSEVERDNQVIRSLSLYYYFLNLNFNYLFANFNLFLLSPMFPSFLFLLGLCSIAKLFDCYLMIRYVLVRDILLRIDVLIVS